MATERNTLRYEAAIATLIGVLALAVSAYTAYEQHLQVRAQVYPILEVGGGNEPIRVSVSNKGVGPAIVRDVVFRVDGKPVKSWDEAIRRVVGGNHKSWTSSLNHHVFAAGETVDIFKPRDDAGRDIKDDGQDDWAVTVWRARDRSSFDICYCSTLEECWNLHTRPGEPEKTTPVRHCPAPSPDSFDD